MFWPFWFQVLGFTLVQTVSGLQWIAGNGTIPSTAVPVRPNGVSLFYFCEVVVSSKGGQRIPGTLKPPDNSSCKYEEDAVVKSSTVFNVLVNPGGTALKWVYRSPLMTGVPAGAVKCHEGDNCYLGQSVHSEGICAELPGKIFSDQTQMIMTNDKGIFKCPFKMYFVETM
ncbi:hypothetical protein SNE40_017310 [Patella caerulea]|uniref:Uncharacterized protein n=1 Tax=Patella caerulea TaxID=87958 RepID=A0AAN8JGU6_PATCE